MKDLLAKLGIDKTDRTIYEYDATNLDWWDSKYPTMLEIEMEVDEEGFQNVIAIFCPDIEGEVERIPVFSVRYKEDEINEYTLVVKEIFIALNTELSLPFLEDHNVYATNSMEETMFLLERIVKLFPDTKPTMIDFNADENIAFGTVEGETLHHFIAMMNVNGLEFSPEHIQTNLAMSEMVEGRNYIKTLKDDVQTEFDLEIVEEYGVDATIFNRIKSVILNY